MKNVNLRYVFLILLVLMTGSMPGKALAIDVEIKFGKNIRVLGDNSNPFSAIASYNSNQNYKLEAKGIYAGRDFYFEIIYGTGISVRFSRDIPNYSMKIYEIEKDVSLFIDLYYQVAIQANNCQVINPSFPDWRFVQGSKDIWFDIKKDPGYENHTIEVKNVSAGECGNISVNQATGRCVIKKVNDDLNIVVNLIAPPPTPPTPPAYFPVSIPSIEGVTTIPAAGKYEMAYGQPFDLTVEVSDAYDKSDIIVEVNGVALAPVSLRSVSYSYRIEKVTSFLDINILGVTKNDPLGIDKADNGTLRFYTSEDALYIDAPQSDTVAVYTLSGALVTQYVIPAGTSRLPLGKGVYIVRVGAETYKIMVND